MTLRERYDNVLQWFGETMPRPETELHYADNFQLLVAVILSAQCTDKRVNMVTPRLFEIYPNAQTMASASEQDLYNLISSISYPNNKARNLLAMAKMLTDNFAGVVPSEIDALISLPGVGRKTANVMLAVAFGQAAMPVDTHVFRVSERIGLTTGSHTPLETERCLTRHIPAALLSRAHHWLILHGRYVCKSRRPDCLNCGISRYCRYYNRNTDKAKSTS